MSETYVTPTFASVSDLIRENAARNPAKLALIDADRPLTWAEFDSRLDRYAAFLQAEGVKKGDRVAIAASMSANSVALFFAIMRAGAVTVPLSPALSDAALAAMVLDAGAGLIFSDRTLPLPPGIRCASMAIASNFAAPPPVNVVIAPHDPCNLIYSSGTTGTPKGIVQPHAMRWAHIQRGASQGYDGNAITLVSTPLYSNTTLVSVYPTVGLGGTMVLMSKFDAREFLALSARHRVTHAMLVPVQYRRIMALPDFDDFDLGAYRMKFCTSAPFAAELKADILARWPGGLVEYYGMTEGGGTCILRAHEHPDKLHTVGCPGPGSLFRVIDEQGRALLPEETGEIVGRSPGMMTGYHGRPEETAAAEWHDENGVRYIRTGDVGRFDADGFLKLVDRRKDMIISGGFNIYPSELEAALLAQPGVLEAAVVGVASEEWGETPVGFVVMDDDAKFDDALLLSQANGALERLQRIRVLYRIGSLPRNAIGKVLKSDLRSIAEAAAKAS